MIVMLITTTVVIATTIVIIDCVVAARVEMEKITAIVVDQPLLTEED